VSRLNGVAGYKVVSTLWYPAANGKPQQRGEVFRPRNAESESVPWRGNYGVF